MKRTGVWSQSGGCPFVQHSICKSSSPPTSSTQPTHTHTPHSGLSLVCSLTFLPESSVHFAHSGKTPILDSVLRSLRSLRKDSSSGFLPPFASLTPDAQTRICTLYTLLEPSGLYNIHFCKRVRYSLNKGAPWTLLEVPIKERWRLRQGFSPNHP